MPSELNPDRLQNLQTKEPPTKSAGFPSVVTALRRVFSAMPFRRGGRALLKLNQTDGFDCPGCAWPDPDERSSIAEYCENGAKAVAEEATSTRADATFFAKHSVEQLSEWTDYELGHAGRLIEPMILREGSSHYRPLGWDEAFQITAAHLNDADDPDRAIFYTSGRTSNEAAFLYQLFVRMYGTNNLPDCSNMCHESSGVALTETLGIGKGSVTLEDFEKAELVIVAGQNPGTNHPRMLSALEKSKENGARIIAINPLNEAGLGRFKNPQRIKGLAGRGTRLADMLLQIRINCDVPLVKALMIDLFERERKDPGSAVDREFVSNKTQGYKELKAHLERYSFADLCSQAGVNEADVRKAADWIAKSERIIICWAMGLTQHVNAVDNIREYVNLLLLRGAVGKPGAGTCPVRGHSNVQGDRTVGIWEKIPPHLLKNLKDNFGFDPPTRTGTDTVHAIKAMADGQTDVFFALGGNFLSATPDTSYTADALRNCKLTVHVSTKLNRSHLVHGQTALVLPCLGRSDIDMTGGRKQFVTVENSMGRVHKSSGVLQPVSDALLSEPVIIARLAEATIGSDMIDWTATVKNYDLIRNIIQKNVPGFDQYNVRVRQDGGFYLPNGARQCVFNTPSGTAMFTINAMPVHELDEDEYMMMTIRSHDQFNTTIYGFEDRYRGISGERRVVLMNSDDIRDAGYAAHDVVDIFSVYNGVRRSISNFQLVPYDIPRRCVATYFPEANPLVPVDEFARGSHTPASKQVRVQITPHTA